MGMILQASEYFDAAEPAYLNAQRLMPREPRWPTSSRICTGAERDTARSIAAFRRVLEIAPDDVRH